MISAIPKTQSNTGLEMIRKRTKLIKSSLIQRDEFSELPHGIEERESNLTSLFFTDESNIPVYYSRKKLISK